MALAFLIDFTILAIFLFFRYQESNNPYEGEEKILTTVGLFLAGICIGIDLVTYWPQIVALF